jgi:hypothetical protein
VTSSRANDQAPLPAALDDRGQRRVIEAFQAKAKHLLAFWPFSVQNNDRFHRWTSGRHRSSFRLVAWKIDFFIKPSLLSRLQRCDVLPQLSDTSLQSVNLGTAMSTSQRTYNYE